MNAATRDEIVSVQLSTAVAIAIGEQTNDVEAFSGWLESASDDREPCAYFGNISTPDLVRQIVLNPNANAEQHHAACMELRSRYLADFAGVIACRAQELA
jgi:hypothetical protein